MMCKIQWNKSLVIMIMIISKQSLSGRRDILYAVYMSVNICFTGTVFAVQKTWSKSLPDITLQMCCIIYIMKRGLKMLGDI